MARTLPTTTAALAVLDGAPVPAGTALSRRTLRLRDRLIASARADLAAAVAADGVTATAEREGVSRSTLQAWRAPGGWLCAAAREEAHGGARGAQSEGRVGE